MELQAQGVGPPMMLSIGKQLGGSNYEWRYEKTNRVVCMKRDHGDERLPVWSCTCGFWFYKKLADLEERVAIMGPSLYVMLAGWGKVIEHEEGVRTEFARPLAAISRQPLKANGYPAMDNERWLRWVELIGMPVISVEEIPMAAQMLELEMLDYTIPPHRAYYE